MELKRGDKGKQVKELQEWLCLNGILVQIDGEFGPATEAAVKQYRKNKFLIPIIGIVDDEMMKSLTLLLWAIDKPVQVETREPLGNTIIRVATQLFSKAIRSGMEWG